MHTDDPTGGNLAPISMTPISTEHMAFPSRSPRHAAAEVEKPAVAAPKLPTSQVSTVDPTAIANAQFYSILLPSGFRPYSFKSIAVRKVYGHPQAKFTRAAAEGNLTWSIEAVASCLSQPELVHQLTLPDYVYLMYWLRLASYTEMSWHHPFRCYNAAHLKAVAEGKATPESVMQIARITSSLIEEPTITPEQEAAFSRLESCINAALAGSGYECDLPRVGSLLETSNYLMEVEVEGEPPNMEIRSLCDQAATLKRLDGQPSSLLERIEFVQQLDVDTIMMLQDLLALSTCYMIREFIEAKCLECGGQSRTSLSISASTFLRSPKPVEAGIVLPRGE